MLDKIKKAISTACKNNYGNEDVDIDVNPEKGVFNVYLRKEIVEEVEDPNRQYLLDKAKQVDPTACVGPVCAHQAGHQAVRPCGCPDRPEHHPPGHP